MFVFEEHLIIFKNLCFVYTSVGYNDLEKQANSKMLINPGKFVDYIFLS